MPTAKPAAVDRIDAFRKDIHENFLKACESLYFINPRSNIDPETGLPTGEEGLQRFRLYPEQLAQAKVMIGMQAARQPVRVVKVKCRQSGDSTFGEVWTFHHMYWRHRQNALVVAHHDTTTTALYKMAQTLYSELPPELQWQQRRFNRKELSFEPPSGSSLVAQTAGYLDIGHGLTLHHVHLSEIDRWPDPEVALEGILETQPFVPGTSTVIESVAQTADGFLHHFWRASKQGRTGFTPIFTPWYAIPEYRLPLPADFYPEAEEQAWIEQYHLSLTQIAWYRAKLQLFMAKEPWGGERRMRSMYPFNDEEAFQSSGFCVFPDTVLLEQKEHVRPPIESVKLYPIGPAKFQPQKCSADMDGALLFWKKPEAGRQYMLGVDVSDGVGQTESVVEIFAYPGYEQVAEWGSANSSVEHTAWVAAWLAELYGGANSIIIPEVNKSGILVLYILQTLPGSYGIFRWRYLDRPGMQMTDQPKLGWYTDEGTKKILVQIANMLFTSGAGVIHSEKMREQMSRCVDVLPSRRWRVAGKGSDRVLAGLIAMTGAYLEYEGGVLGDMVAEDEAKKAAPRGRERGAWDDQIEQILATGRVAGSRGFLLDGDLEG